MSVESMLRAATLTGSGVPPGLEVAYSDLHGLWGGIAVTVNGSGHAERHVSARGSGGPPVTEANVAADELLELLALLVELEAWEQRTPEGDMLLPDESRATLTIRIGGHASSIWERFNEMEANQRLIRIKAKMTEMSAPDR